MNLDQLRKGTKMSREIMQQALSAFETIMFEKDTESCQLIAKNARYALREELAKPEQDQPCQTCIALARAVMMDQTGKS